MFVGALLLVALVATALMARVSSEAVLFPECRAAAACVLHSGAPTAPFDLPPVSASLFHLDLPHGQGVSEVSIYLLSPEGGPQPAVFVQPWLAPILMMFASSAPAGPSSSSALGLSALCGLQLSKDMAGVTSPPPGRLYVAVANGNLTHSARNLRLTAVAVPCPNNGTGYYCALADAVYPGTPVVAPLLAQPWYSPQPSFTVEFGPEQFPAEFWESVDVTAKIVGIDAARIPVDARPTVALDFGTIAPATGEGTPWSALAHAACAPANWTDALECSASIRMPKRGRYFVSVYPSIFAPLSDAQVVLSVGVAAMPPSATAELQTGAAAVKISPQVEAQALYFDVDDPGNKTYTLLVCNDQGQLYGGIGIGASEGGLPALNRGSEFCQLFSDDETADAHYYFEQTAPGRYFVQLANVPVDGSWNVRVVPGRQDCA